MKIGDNRYCRAAWPTLALDTCHDHRHTPRTESLARALAIRVGWTDPADEQIGQWMDDAGSMVDDHPGVTDWIITDWRTPATLDEEENEELPRDAVARFVLNGIEYVVPESEWEPSPPVKLSTYRTWFE